MNRNLIIKSAIAASLIAMSASVFADTATDSFNVEVFVNGSCTVSVPDLIFGNYVDAQVATEDANTILTVHCSSSLPYDIDLSQGKAASYTPRIMDDGGANSINYNLFNDAAYSNIWGDGSGSTVTQSGTGTGGDQTYTVYGRIPGNQTVSATVLLTDSITATVTY